MAPLGRALIFGGLIAGGGYAIMKLVTPTDKQFYDSLSPELKRRVDDQRGAELRKQQYAKIKASADAGEPIFHDTASSKR